MSTWQQVSKKKHTGRRRFVPNKADILRFDISRLKKNQEERREEIKLDDPRVQLVREKGAKEVITSSPVEEEQSKKKQTKRKCKHNTPYHSAFHT